MRDRHFVRRRDASTVAAELTSICVTLAAIALFVFLAGRLIPPAMLAMLDKGPAANQSLGIALLLNIALILFGWRRCKELRAMREAQQAAEEAARQAAYVDFTTGLPNRRWFTEEAARALTETTSPTVVMVIDLDNFKRVNDRFGHPVGDELLKTVSRLLLECVPENMCIARLGGDEFAVLLSGDAAVRENTCAVAARILDRLSQPIRLRSAEAHIGASIGIALNRDAHTSVEDLMTRSDIAMYSAKDSGRNCFAWFSEDMEEDLRRKAEVEAEIREGLLANQFIPFFQPQISLDSGEVQGFEVLARWQHPVRGLLDPAEFISIAETTGLIAELSLAVMGRALAEAKNWDPRLIIAVNISPVQLKDPLLSQRIQKLLLEVGFPAQRLELEITESSFLDDLDLAVATIHSLKNLGVTISLDDFGTGYSSLTQLKALPFDRLKVDQSFVKTMIESDESAAIVSAIVSLGASLSLPVTAEGVETAAIEGTLRRMGCAEAQGWHFGRAIPANEVASLLSDGAEAFAADHPTIVPPLQAEPLVPERRDHSRRGSRSARR